MLDVDEEKDEAVFKSVLFKLVKEALSREWNLYNYLSGRGQGHCEDEGN